MMMASSVHSQLISNFAYFIYIVFFIALERYVRVTVFSYRISQIVVLLSDYLSTEHGNQNLLTLRTYSPHSSSVPVIFR